MLPAADAAGAAGGVVKGKGVRAAARANIVLGLAMAAMALVAATTNPGSNFHAQIVSENASSAPAPAPAPGAEQCAATEAEAVDLRGMALLLVLTGVGQALVGMAADVALAGSIRMLGGGLTVAAHLFGAMNAGFLCYVVNRVGVLAIGHCAAGPYLVNLAVAYAFVAVSYAGLLGLSLAVTCC